MLFSALCLGLVALSHAVQAIKKFESANFILVDSERSGVTWGRSRSYCKDRLKSNLATVDSAAKQAELAKLMSDNGYTTDKDKAWLGATDAKNDGDWRWSDGSAMVYKNWNVGEPNGQSRENCLMTWPHASYRWNDGVCSSSGICKAFVCDKPAGCDCDGKGNWCNVPTWSVKKAGLFWAWASPCGGACSNAVLKNGWRYATEEEWKNLPSKKEFFRNLKESEWCAASFFDPKYNHCDENDPLIRVPDGSNKDTVLVHDTDRRCGQAAPAPARCDCDGRGNDCSVPDWAVEKGGLFWAWASPCSGLCSQAELKYGWRYATPKEWRNVPTKKEFQRNLKESEWCAAKIFDPKYNHCDESNKLVRVPDNGKNEQVLVHDPCQRGSGCMCSKRSCKQTGFAHYDRKTKLYWAWASPCSGGCSKLKDPIPYGWRRATASEWAAKGFNCDEAGLKFFGYNLAWDHGADGQQIKSAEYPDTCASNIFDDRWEHCDAVNFKDGKCTYKEGDHYFETLIVHDSDPAKCKAAQEDESYWMNADTDFYQSDTQLADPDEAWMTAGY